MKECSDYRNTQHGGLHFVWLGWDTASRLASFGLDGGYAAQTVSYREDGRIGSISNADVVVDYAYSDDGYDIGYTLSVAGGAVFTRTLTRDPYRRELVLNIANSAGGNFAYAYDAISRHVTRNDDAFGYNARSEVTSATIGGISSVYGYDEIGNSTNWTANCLNQYSHCVYDADGNMTVCGPWSYTYDSANRLATVSSNEVLLVTNSYDTRSRRVRKVTSEATTTFFYDDWNLVEERVAYANGSTSTIHYYWGKDISGTFQGAGGVGGLLYLTVDGAVYIPCYDNNGNVMRYLDANGMTVASYVYDAFGCMISLNGSLANVFRHRFSSKYFDVETGLHYYGYRFYSPALTSWLTRDPIGEKGGINLYLLCANNTVNRYDKDGCAYFAKRRLENMPWLGEFSMSLSMDILNIEFSHEHLFFEDGLTSGDLGLHSDGKVAPDTPHDNYIVTSGHYNDCVMRKAVDMVGFKHEYSLLGLWGKEKFNCQDWATDVRAFYYSLYSDKKVRCECNIRD